jgi:GNAT superfamily N-acetyltransferase
MVKLQSFTRCSTTTRVLPPSVRISVLYSFYDVTMSLEIRPAKLEDVDAASSILLEAANWLAQTGEMRWKPEQFSPEQLEPLVNAGELHLAFQGSQAVGTMYLQLEDQAFWSDVQSAESLFIHKLAVSLNARGTGVAPAFIEFAKLEVQRRGRKYLRLDCRDHAKIRGIYENAGFELGDIGTFFDTIVCRYEIKLD